jgi:membrane protease YdiL (CAAX protease family)
MGSQHSSSSLLANGLRPTVTTAVWTYVVIIFAISWLVWISALALGARPGTGEETLAFGAAGPAVAAVFLSRNGRKVPRVRLGVRVRWFALLWLLCWVVYVIGDRMRGARPTLSLRFGLVVALLAAIPAWICSGAFWADAGVRKLLQTLVVPGNWRWQAVAFFSFPALLLIPAAIARLLGIPVVMPSVNGSVSSFVALGALTFFRNLFFTAVLEEPGWRGFLLPHLQLRFSPLTATLLVWFLWALWHVPLDFSGPVGRTWLSYLQIRVVFFIPIAVVLTWIYNRSGGNILSIAIFHAAFNTFPFFLPYAPLMLSLLFVWAAYVVIRNRMWQCDGRQHLLARSFMNGRDSGR